MIVLKWALEKVGVYYVVSPTYKQGKSIHWTEIRKEIPRAWVAKTNETELSITLKNGSVIEFKGAENPDALRGVKLRGLVIDEIASIRNWDWLWQEVLRPTLTDYKAPAIFISTPKGFNHFYALYQYGQGSDEGHDNNYKSWRFTSYDNPYIPKEEIDNAKKELTEDTFAQEYLADFRKFTGLVYKGFAREIHVIEPFDIPEAWSIYRGVDFGNTNPTACLWVAVDNDENWFVVDEHYQSEKTIDFHAGAINSNPYSASGRVVVSYGDPSGAQWIQEFTQRGVYITPATKETSTSFNSWVRLGIEKVAEKLKPVPGHIVRFGDTEMPSTQGRPSLFVFSTCVNTIKEFETYRWKEKSVSQAQDLNEPDVPEKANDHCFTGDTMILTKTGWKRIDRIKKGEYVWSPFGWNEVYRAGSTGKKLIKDYGIFKSTPNHKVLTARGLVEVDTMRYDDIIMSWHRQRPYTFKEFLTGVIQTPITALIAFIFNALLIKSLMARRDFYTETYGNTITAKFLTAIWYIILTATLAITTFLISIWWLLANTLRSIAGAYGMAWKNILNQSKRKQKNGTLLTRVKNGIVNMVKGHGWIEKGPLRHAMFAGNNSNVFLLELNTARMPVKQQHFDVVEVYNLATRFGMYFANGILVSNSMDALRYFAVSYTKRARFEMPPPYQPTDPVIGI